jgi:phage-related minor tail protein
MATGGESGFETLGIEIDVTGAETSNQKLDRVIEKLGAVVVSIEKVASSQDRYNKIKADGADIQANAAARLVAKLNELNATYGKGQEAIYAYRASQLGIATDVEKQIAALTHLRVIKEQGQATEKRDIELLAIRAKAEKDTMAAKVDSANSYFVQLNKEVTATERRDLELHTMRTKDAAERAAARDADAIDYFVLMNKQLAATEKRDVELHAMRTKEEASRIAARDLEAKSYFESMNIEIAAEEKRAAQAIAIAEKQAIAEIKWGETSLKARIEQLAKLRTYQANSNISAATTASAFSHIPVVVQSDAAKLEKEYSEALLLTAVGHGKVAASAGLAAEEVKKVGIQTSRATTELVVMGREISRGNFSRLAGSFTIFAQSLGVGLLNPLTLAIAAVAGLAYIMAKGSVEQDRMNASLVSTGNYAGITSGALNQMAHDMTEVSGSLSEAKKALTELAGSGKFTSDQMRLVADAAVTMEHATGKSIESTIKEFESLNNKMTGDTIGATFEVTKALIKLDEHYHFLTASVLQQILAYEKEGETAKASALATKIFGDSVKDRAAQMIADLGYVARAWNAVTESIGHAIDKLMAWGKKDNASTRVQSLKDEIKDLDGTSNSLTGQDNSLALKARRLDLTKQLADAQGKLNISDEAAAKIGEKTRATSESNKSIVDITEQKYKLGKHSQTREEEELEKYNTRLGNLRKDGLTAQTSDLLTEKSILEQQALIHKAYAEKAVTVKKVPGLDTRMPDMRSEITNLKANYDDEKSLFATEEENLKIHHDKLKMSDEEYNTLEEAARAKFITATESFYAAELKINDGYAAKTPREIAERTARHDAILREENKFHNDMDKAMARKELDGQIKEQASYDQIYKDIDRNGTAELKSIESSTAAEAKHTRELGLTVKQKEQVRHATEQQTIAQLELDAVSLKTYIDSGKFSERDVQAYRMQLGFIQKEIAARKDLDAEYSKGAAIAAQQEAAKNLATSWKTAGSEISAALTSAFGDGGKALAGMVDAYTSFKSKQIQLDAEYENSKRAAENLNGGEKTAALIAAETKLRQDSAQAEIKSYGDMASAAKGFFEKNSTGYKIMEAAERGFRLVELAMTIQNMVAKIGATTSVVSAHIIGEQAIQDSSIAGTGMQLAQDQIRGASAAAVGIATQAQGDPYSAWIRMAAMAAAMAALGFIVGGSGGSTSAQDTTATDRQAANGTGTVLGDSKAKSDSITKSMELLKANSDIMLPINQSMLSSLRKIESGISGMAAMVSRTMGVSGGIFDTSGLGIGSSKGFLGFNSSSTTLTDQGLSMTRQQSLGDIRARGSADALGYQDTHTHSSSWWGLSQSDSDSRRMTEVGDDLKRQMALVFNGISDGIATASKSLGFNYNQVKDWLSAMKVTLGDISFKGLTGTQIADQLNARFGQIGDMISAMLVPGIRDFQKAGEGYFQTLIRVASGVEQAKVSLDNLGIASVNYTNIIDKQGDVATEIVRQSLVATEYVWSSIGNIQSAMGYVGAGFNHVGDTLSGVGKILNDFSGTAQDLIDLYKQLMSIRRDMMAAGLSGQSLSTSTIQGAGGLSQLSSGAATYRDKYFTDSEKLSMQSRDVADQFNKIFSVFSNGSNVVLPKSRDEFKALMQSVDTTTPAGQRLQGQLLAMAGAFSDLQDNLAKTIGVVENPDAKQYRDNYWTAGQRVALQTGLLAEQFQALGFALPLNKDAMMSMIDGIDKTTYSGQRLLAQLLPLANSFSDLAANKLAAVTNATGAVSSAYKTQSSELKTLTDKLKSFQTGIETFRNSLLLDNLSTLTPEQKFDEAKRQYQTTLSKASMGDETARGQVQSAATAYLSASQVINASSQAYTDTAQQVQTDLASLSAMAGTQLTSLEKQQKALDDQVLGIINIASAVMTTTEAVNQFKDMVRAMAPQNAAGGVTSPLSPTSGYIGIPYGENGPSAAGLNYNSAAEKLMTASVYTPPPAAPAPAPAPAPAAPAAPPRTALQIATQQMGYNPFDPSEEVKSNTVAYKDPNLDDSGNYSLGWGNSHASGLNYVPFDGYRAKLHKGERVLTSFESNNYSPSNNVGNAALVQEFKALLEEVKGLRDDQQGHTGALIGATYDANHRNAKTINEGQDKAANTMVWAEKSKAKIK